MRCGIMLQKCHKHLVYGRVGESAEQDAAPRAPYDLGNDSRFPRAGRAPNEVEHFAVRGAADGFDLAGVERTGFPASRTTALSAATQPCRASATSTRRRELICR